MELARSAWIVNSPPKSRAYNIETYSVGRLAELSWLNRKGSIDTKKSSRMFSSTSLRVSMRTADIVWV